MNDDNKDAAEATYQSLPASLKVPFLYKGVGFNASL